MPRNGSGVYTLPAGNPVVGGTTIDTTWANPTMEDIAVQLNNVLTRDGILGPTLAFPFVDGTSALPGATFALSLGTGLFRTALNLGISFGGAQKVSIFSTGAAVFDNLLAVPSGAGTTSNMTVHSQSDTANSNYLQLLASTTEAVINSAQIGTGTVRPLLFKMDDVEYMRLDTSGRLGIGGTPTANPLEVHATASVIEARSTGGVATFLATGSGTNNALIKFSNVTSGLRGQIKVDNTGIMTFSNGVTPTDRMFIDATGLVGIGAAPTVALDVNVASASMRLNSSTGTNSTLIQQANTGGTLSKGLDNSSGSVFGQGAYAAGFWSTANTDMVFATNNTLRMKITAAGAIQDGSGSSLNNKNFPQNSLSAAYNTVLADAGKQLYRANGAGPVGNLAVTLTSGIYSIGDYITVICQDIQGMTVAPGGADTMVWAPTGATGTRTVARYCVLFCLRTGATEWTVWGFGIT